MNFDKKKTVAEIVAENYRSAEVFRDFGVDFCCGGKRTVEEVCEQKGIDAQRLRKSLEDLGEEYQAARHDFQEWDPVFLMDYIEQVHHTYIRKKLPHIMAHGAKVSKVHGHAYPEVRRILALTETMGRELLHHLESEEEELFPALREYFSSSAKDREAPSLHVFEQEHEIAGNILKEIRDLSNQFTPPPGACNTFKVWYAMLEEFEKDLHQHVHLENNILFQRMVEKKATSV